MKPGAIWVRLCDRSKFPRWVWYPEDKIDPPPSNDLWRTQFESVSATIRRTMLAFMGYAFFCLLILGQPIKEVLASGVIQVPIANTNMSFRAFLIMGPILLAGLTLYLHIFVGQWEVLRRGHEQAELMPPFIFNLPNPFASFISWSIFYPLPMVLIFLFAVRSMPAPKLVVMVPILIHGFGIPTLLFLGLRRSRGLLRIFWWLTFPAFVLYGFVVQGAVDFPQELTRANLRNANLAGFYFERASLRAADLSGANLEGAILIDADLRDANMSDVYLKEADLTRANLTGAKNLNCSQLIVAENWETALRDRKLGCDQPIPADAK